MRTLALELSNQGVAFLVPPSTSVSLGVPEIIWGLAGGVCGASSHGLFMLREVTISDFIYPTCGHWHRGAHLRERFVLLWTKSKKCCTATC